MPRTKMPKGELQASLLRYLRLTSSSYTKTMKTQYFFITLLVLVGFAFAQEEGAETTLFPKHIDDGSFVQNIQLDPSTTGAFGQGAEINWTEGVLRVRGAGTTQAGLSMAQARLRGTGAARADALRLLATTVNGVNITAETTVREYVLESDVVRISLEAYLKGVKFPDGGIEIEEMSDGSFIVYVIAELPMYGESALTGTVLPDFQERNGGARGNRSFFLLTEAGTHFFAAAAQTSYTGVVFDLTSLGNVGTVALAPTVVSQSGQVVYNINNVAPQALAAQGMTNYYSDVNAALFDPRVGGNPYVVQALSVANNGAIVISDSDAAVLQQMHFVLQNGNVTMARGLAITGTTINNSLQLSMR